MRKYSGRRGGVGKERAVDELQDKTGLQQRRLKADLWVRTGAACTQNVLPTRTCRHCEVDRFHWLGKLKVRVVEFVLDDSFFYKSPPARSTEFLFPSIQLQIHHLNLHVLPLSLYNQIYPSLKRYNPSQAQATFYNDLLRTSR